MSAGSVRVVKRAGKLAERMKQKGVLSLVNFDFFSFQS